MKIRKRVKLGGVVLPVVPPEHLLIMKIGTGEKKDEEDAVRIIRHCSRLKVDVARKLAAKHAGPAAVGKLEALLRENNHPKAHTRKKYS